MTWTELFAWLTLTAAVILTATGVFSYMCPWCRRAQRPYCFARDAAQFSFWPLNIFAVLTAVCVLWA